MDILLLTERLTRRIYSEWFLLFNKHRFQYIGNNIRIYRPLRIDGASNISILNNARISEGTWLAAESLTGFHDTNLIIEENVRIGHFNHIYCTHSIKIEANVLTADKVYISDNAHEYEDISIPICEQPIKQLKTVVIGEGSWIGENVCIIGASVGKHCVVGANSVVTKNIPDYSVAVGAPAKIIKIYNQSTQNWEKISQ